MQRTKKLKTSTWFKTLLAIMRIECYEAYKNTTYSKSEAIIITLTRYWKRQINMIDEQYLFHSAIQHFEKK